MPEPIATALPAPERNDLGHASHYQPEPSAAAVLGLRVRNHPGTMSHVTGLFARRGFNLEAIVCVPEADGIASRMLLLVIDEPRLEQVERQLAKLYDVLEVRHRSDLTAEYFYRLTRFTAGDP